MRTFYTCVLTTSLLAPSGCDLPYPQSNGSEALTWQTEPTAVTTPPCGKKLRKLIDPDNVPPDLIIGQCIVIGGTAIIPFRPSSP